MVSSLYEKAGIAGFWFLLAYRAACPAHAGALPQQLPALLVHGKHAVEDVALPVFVVVWMNEDDGHFVFLVDAFAPAVVGVFAVADNFYVHTQVRQVKFPNTVFSPLTVSFGPIIL